MAGAGALLAAGMMPARAAALRLMSAARLGGSDGAAAWRDGALSPVMLPGRGHAPTRLDGGKAVVMGRRPGMFGAIVDADDLSAPPRIFAPSDGNRFAGHAAFDGKQLVTAEFDAATVAAVLAARDPATGAERTRWNLGGIEPHEVLFDRGRLFAALGGLIKDGGVAGPAFNPDGIKSEVVEVDPKSGAVLARHGLGIQFASLSLRHLAAGRSAMAVAAQDQDLSETRPLVALLTDALTPLPMPSAREADFRGYIGSVAFDSSGDIVAAASPRGGVVGFWSASRHVFLGALPIADGCGVAAAAESGMFWVSSGHGGLYKLSPEHIEAQWHADAGFDHHLITV